MSEPNVSPVSLTGLNRREMLGHLARWTVPSVVTITLGAKVLAAAPSCPPCSKKNAGKCKACSVSQILNCQCEPCLGAPYCTGPGPGGAAASSNLSVPSGGDPRNPNGSDPRMPGGILGGTGPADERARAEDRSGRLQSGQLYQNPLTAEPRYRGLGRSPFDNSGLYGRLRGDSVPTRRRP